MGLPALSAAQDSTRAPLFTARDAWMAGAFAVGTAAVMPLDRSLAERLQLPSNQAKSGYRNAATAFRELGDPGTVIIAGGMYITGWLSRNALLTDVGLHSGEAIVAASVAGTAAKLLTGRARPRVNVEDPHSFAFGRGLRSNDYQSFP
ncbi:MAG TPA: hypothetical protein VG818_04925, partial [Gemmatimonadaceae bacterium]|nr:hypothetical protein [Gemmatimonadaceae bacterium]